LTLIENRGPWRFIVTDRGLRSGDMAADFLKGFNGVRGQSPNAEGYLTVA
jgi:hypothetical protein